jgi:hypothetical protein
MAEEEHSFSIYLAPRQTFGFERKSAGILLLILFSTIESRKFHLTQLTSSSTKKRYLISQIRFKKEFLSGFRAVKQLAAISVKL